MQNPIRNLEPHWPSWATPALAAVPVAGVNAVAFYGQLAFLREKLPAPPVVQVLVAAVLESVAVYLAWQAHLAQLANDTSLRLRLGAYGFALVIAVCNYSHYAGPGWRPTFAAVAFGLMSAASPWLWGIHTRRVSRDALMKDDQIEGHALRLGATRWVWHPAKSFAVMSHATWVGETKPAEAITAVYPQESQGPAADEPVSVLDKVPASAVDAARKRLRFALANQFKYSDNEMRGEFGLTRAQAELIRADVLAESNGHAPT